MTDGELQHGVGVLGVVRAHPGCEAALGAALRALVEFARNEPETVLFALHAVRDRPGSYVLFERYRNEQAWLRHRRSPAMESFKDDMERLVAEREITVLVPDATFGLPDTGAPSNR
ncbi:putative quinol monooxygenase [Frankia sp. Cr1]|uniref:putative quinol monooxygenase n=1 Tax=Frankia sp. Cr1 TaxID=3073931 RepID=UPI002AD28DD0|nr:antibiotic biosynthesis monooxygenase [Frankia sp. Cr1]